MGFIKPNWPAPDNIRAVTTTAGCNCLQDIDRQLLRGQLNLPSEPIWLNQQHLIEVVDLGAENYSVQVDGSYTNKANIVCAVLTADCLPILLCSDNGTEIAAIHAGWRGLLNGVISSGVRHFKCQPGELFAWLGPAISQQAFEVGNEVYEAFIQKDSQAAAAFCPGGNSNRFMADLYQLARLQLNQLGIYRVYGGNFCTYSDRERFYSYRRDKQTGRMGTLIWRE